MLIAVSLYHVILINLRSLSNVHRILYAQSSVVTSRFLRSEKKQHSEIPHDGRSDAASAGEHRETHLLQSLLGSLARKTEANQNAASCSELISTPHRRIPIMWFIFRTTNFSRLFVNRNSNLGLVLFERQIFYDDECIKSGSKGNRDCESTSMRVFEEGPSTDTRSRKEQQVCVCERWVPLGQVLYLAAVGSLPLT